MSHDNQWNEKVQRGRALVTEINDRKWELGDLANEVCPAGTPGAHDERLGQFADEIGVSRQTLNEYRTVAAAWGPSARAEGQTYTTHRMLAARDDRFDIIAEQTWTYNSLSDRLGRLPNPSRAMSPAGLAGAAAADAENTPEAKREQFRTGLLRDTGEREPSNDAAGRNLDKLDRVYELRAA